MDPLKHECGIAMIRLLKPISYYKEKYGSYAWALKKLYLLMEKQHNRGQEGAGIGVVKLHALPGSEFVFRERALGTQAIREIFDNIGPELEKIQLEHMSPQDVEQKAPFVGEIYLGHLRYSTTGKSGMSYVHPFLRRNNWPSRNLLLCGNFNMTNVDEIFKKVVEKGQHPRIYSDTVMLLEQLGYALDKENHKVYRKYRDTLPELEITKKIEEEIDIKAVLKAAAPTWDGGYVICGATGSGDMFALRDAKGIRPAYYYQDEEVVVVASERPVLQTVFNIARKDVKELEPGFAITVTAKGKTEISQILDATGHQKCSFERIYFSRGSDADIYQERKQLGKNLVPEILEKIGNDIDHTVFSFIPNTAEVAFIGMIEGLEYHLNNLKIEKILKARDRNALTDERVKKIIGQKLRIEKIAIKDIKLRTFITEGESRDELAAHVYDVTYGCVANNEDNLVVIDDSIVRGTTLTQSILRILDRLHPKKIIVVSSSPQVRYPDYYGIDMSSLGEFAAFRAAIALLKEKGMEHVIKNVYERCLEMAKLPDNQQVNCVKEIYAPFSQQEVAAKMAEMLTPPGTHAEVRLIFQTLKGLHEAIPGHQGDWYFSGHYPTPGGVRLVNKAFVAFYEKKNPRN
ncbi:MAG: amidophosphoribosyltransferase [Muribaculaceae bacterium]|nr:amidophosphoribosyltransferase [Muribaculaceae bacterium]